MNNLGRILRVYAKPRIFLWQASVGTATAKRAKLSGSKKDTLPKSKAKSEPKDTLPKSKAKSEPKDTLPKSKAKSGPKETLPKTKAKRESKDTLPKSEAKSEPEGTLPKSEGESEDALPKSEGESEDTLSKSETKSESKDESVKDSKKKTSAASVSAHLNADGTRTSVWLMKSEPHTFSIDDLINSNNSTSQWEGVRSHEAKNLMKHSMKIGDQVLFYHSNTKEPGIVGLAKIAKESYPDHTAFDPKSDYFDSKSDKDEPRWFMVDVQFVRRLKRTLTLKELQEYKDKELKDMKLLNRGRLSVQPVSNTEMEFIMELENKDVATE
ncbi:MAG: PUA-like domain-containing protein [Benniella sp.]|nr:MAG: PUA-like domain-containing protein [Benniella sp.]